MSFHICVISWLTHFNIVFLLPMWVKYVCCVHARDLLSIPKIIYDQLMQRMSECRSRVGNCGRSFLSPKIYKIASARRMRCLGPYSEPRVISAACLPTLSICRGFPRDYIGTCVVSSLELRHSAGRGWLLRALVAVGFSWLAECYSCISWWSVPCRR